MKSFQAVSRGFDTPNGGHIAKGVICVIRLDALGEIRLMSANGASFNDPGISLKPYELHEYFKLGHSAPKP